MKQYLTIDIGGTYIKYALMTEEAEVLNRDKVLTPRDNETHFYQVMKDICVPYLDNIAGIAVSATGIVDLGTGYVKDAALGDIMDLDLLNEMQKFCKNIPISIENDAKSAALAELWKGAASEADSAVLVIIGTAIGGAVIIDRKVVRGARQFAGEFSFLIGNNAADPAYNTCAAMELGVPGLVSLASSVSGIPEDKLSGEEIFRRAEEKDEKMIEALKIYASKLAILCTNLNFTLDPDAILIGGGVSEQPLLISLLREACENVYKNFFIPGLPVPEVRACRFNNDANLIGALYAHLQK